jgi:hypothetical protein
MSQDRAFNEVIAALASYNRRQRPPLTPAEVNRQSRQREIDRMANNKLHRKAVERRKKRKRGGPK